MHSSIHLASSWRLTCIACPLASPLPACVPASVAWLTTSGAMLALQAYGLHDTLGCLLDRDGGAISFTKNGQPLGEAFQLPQVYTRWRAALHSPPAVQRLRCWPENAGWLHVAAGIEGPAGGAGHLA